MKIVRNKFLSTFDVDYCPRDAWEWFIRFEGSFIIIITPQTSVRILRIA